MKIWSFMAFLLRTTMHYKFFYFCISLGFLVISGEAFSGTAGNLKILLQSIHSFQADFSQSLYNSSGNTLKQYQGNIALKPPHLFRWEITSPLKQLTLSDGPHLWTYDADLKQVLVQSVKKSKTLTPAMVLSETGTGILNNFFISQQKEWFILKPKANAMVKKISLLFSKNQLVEMQLLDNLGQTTVIQFSNIKMNQPLPKSFFKFKIPKDADVVRLA
jgi:outer membrane lipoprotein carrier protein